MDPILIDFPHEFYTDRLHIRLPLPGDGKKVYQSIQASLSEIKPWLPFAQHPQTEEETEVNVRNAHIHFLKREDLRMLGFHKETGELVCSTGLHRMDWEVPKFEIGYWVDSRYSGKGYITEAVDGLTEFAFRELKAKRIEIRCDLFNDKSRAIPEKLGYELEGVLKNDDLSVDGLEVRDTCIYAKIRRGQS
ncbi:GNAT family N-acetyltransferase [Halobacillus sp. Marseille-P3879]|uniref:GNAT family N-acetyltransferase n=1 Tax=Halobacillus TaxID=45667 RepID=UPI000C7D009A|nr:GNAT family N-acetyltransferase [Halobacillus sp. Marseille-P3879]